MYSITKGDNFYSQNNPFPIKVYKTLFGFAKDEITEALLRRSTNNNIPLHIADYGCADAVGFYHLLPDILDMIRNEASKDKTLHLMMNDLPENDFCATQKNFQTYCELRAMKDNRISLTISRMSFYEQCFLDNIVNIAFTATSLHWLSKRPCLISEHQIVCASLPLQRKFELQAEEDWEAFLINRGKELVQGGLLIAMIQGKDKTGKYTGCTRDNTQCLFKLMGRIWLEISKLQPLTEEEQHEATHPVYRERTMDDILKPFKTKQSKVHKYGLILVKAETLTIPSPLYEEMELSNGYGNKDAMQIYANKFVKSIKTWHYNTIYRALDVSRSEDERKAICEKYYRRLYDEILHSPQDYVLDYVSHYVIVAKKSEQQTDT